jgi:hypothetical protein
VRGSDAARVVLAGVRIVNGTASLVAPATFLRRLGAEPDDNGPALYALRLFGVRTILIGADLLSKNRRVRSHALRVALLIHLSDTLAAGIALAGDQLPRKGAKTALVTSSVNTALSLIAARGVR